MPNAVTTTTLPCKHGNHPCTMVETTFDYVHNTMRVAYRVRQCSACLLEAVAGTILAYAKEEDFRCPEM